MSVWVRRSVWVRGLAAGGTVAVIARHRLGGTIARRFSNVFGDAASYLAPKRGADPVVITE